MASDPTEQQQLAGYLTRGGAAMSAGGILLFLSGTFARSGGPALTTMGGLGLMMLAVGIGLLWYARTLRR
ncbi:MAG: hypothetical protein Q4F65_08575 [Propionibacteriaceae bacterium]|nr:hypothetical protein [Propionibacteriaceae bacterium]